jgi:hypothetical protein
MPMRRHNSNPTRNHYFAPPALHQKKFGGHPEKSGADMWLILQRNDYPWMGSLIWDERIGWHPLYRLQL